MPETGVNKRVFGSTRSRFTFRTSSVSGASKFANKTMTTLSPSKHKYLRNKSPIEQTLPKDFSPRRDVAYLFESEQQKYGAYKSPLHRKDQEQLNNMTFNKPRTVLKRINNAY